MEAVMKFLIVITILFGAASLILRAVELINSGIQYTSAELTTIGFAMIIISLILSTRESWKK